MKHDIVKVMSVIEIENKAIEGAISCAVHQYKEMVTHTKNGTRSVDVVGASMQLDAMRSMSTLHGCIMTCISSLSRRNLQQANKGIRRRNNTRAV